MMSHGRRRYDVCTQYFTSFVLSFSTIYVSIFLVIVVLHQCTKKVFVVSISSIDVDIFTYFHSFLLFYFTFLKKTNIDTMYNH